MIYNPNHILMRHILHPIEKRKRKFIQQSLEKELIRTRLNRGAVLTLQGLPYPGGNRNYSGVHSVAMAMNTSRKIQANASRRLQLNSSLVQPNKGWSRMRKEWAHCLTYFLCHFWLGKHKYGSQDGRPELMTLELRVPHIGIAILITKIYHLSEDSR